jgi:hypothetical protein
LRTQASACVLHYSPRGTLVILKTKGADLATLQGHTFVRVTHDLHSKPTAPVIRSLFQWSDRTGATLRFEAFTNVADPQQRADFRRLAGQNHFHVLGYDERLELAVTRRVDNSTRREMVQIAEMADKLQTLIPDEEYDFEAAKQRVLKGAPR